VCEITPLSGQLQKGETDKSVQACNDWLRLGVGRSLPKLLENYANSNQKSPPTSSLGTLKQWSLKFKWTERATKFDAEWEERKNAERQAELDYGLALDYERVNKLKRLADFLEGQLFEVGENGDYHNVWLPDVKQIGSGEYAERVDIERFNSSLVSEYRSVLDDIAKEVGGRVKKQEHSGPGGKPIKHEHSMADVPDSDLDDILSHGESLT
jgi:hypothetical protein